MINGIVSLALPKGLSLPVHLSMVVPVSETIRVQMNVPVHIELGEAGLDSAVEDPRDAFHPLNAQIDRLPDGVVSRW